MYDASRQFNALKNAAHVTVLGIESSCDETAAAVVTDGRVSRSCAIASQIDIHRRFGGVVPEVASRNHTLAVQNVVEEALSGAGATKDDIDAIAVTYGAGLAGALLVGVTAAKTLAYAWNKPLVKVDHIEGHIAANYVAFPDLEPPFLAAVASGGHTSIVDVRGYNDFALLGSTRDDALGEAFDKTARLLGLPYPGGPEVDRLAKNGVANIEFIKPHALGADLSLSYSGLKTAVVNYVHNKRQRGEEIPVADVCASLQTTAVDLFVRAVLAAAERTGRNKIVLAGGVACNSFMRKRLSELGGAAGREVLYPAPLLCTDNAVMIAARAYFSIREGRDLAPLSLEICPALITGAEA